MVLHSPDMNRYQRQIILPEFGIEGQKKLGGSSVLVVGLGGLGSPVALYLAGMGIGTIGLIDGDQVDLTNIHRQVLYDEHSVGFQKVTVAAMRIRAANSEIIVREHDTFLTPDNVAQIITEYDIIVDGSDNFSTRYLLNDTAVTLGKCVVGAAIQGMRGQISVFNAECADGSRGPTLRCLFPEPPPAALAPPCLAQGVLGVVPGVFGMLQATEVIKLITGIGEPLVGKLLIADLARCTFQTVTFERNEVIVAKTKIQSGSYYQRMCMNNIPSEVREISPEVLNSKMATGEKLTLVDVREEFERVEDSIGGLHIPMAQVLQRLEEIPKDHPVVVYCRSGGRSFNVVSELQTRHGFTNLLNLAGGMLAIRSVVVK